MSLNKITKFLLILLIIVCVFDPPDQIFHMKMPLFIGCWLMVIVSIISSNRQIYLPYNVVNYSLAFIIILLLSILYYYIMDGSEPYDGFIFLKAYLFPTLIVLLYVSRIDLLHPLCIILTLLSLLIIAIPLIRDYSPLAYGILSSMGQEYGVLRLGERVYGGIRFETVFYVTSPMIAIAVATYVYKSMVTTGGKRILNIILSVINIYAMFLAGIRNTIIVSILLPLIVMFWFSKHKLIMINIFMAICIAVILSNVGVVVDMFDSENVSNAVKIGYLEDYNKIFSNIRYLLFGQGIGAYNYWTVLGQSTSGTELTYMEVFRNYGILLGSLVILLLLYPFKYFKGNNMDCKCALLGYASYLIMCASNPLLFSSSGMLMLSIVMSRCFYLHNVNTTLMNSQKVVFRLSNVQPVG